MAQNEMKAKPALPERVRSMEGLGVTLRGQVFIGCRLDLGDEHFGFDEMLVLLQPTYAAGNRFRYLRGNIASQLRVVLCLPDGLWDLDINVDVAVNLGKPEPCEAFFTIFGK